jgi:hypothetical protein
LSACGVVLTLCAVACAPRADAGRDQYQVGFDHPVTLDGSRSRRADHFEWRELEGPQVTIEGADQPVARFRTRPIGEVVPLGQFPGPIAMGQQARYRFQLIVRDSRGREAHAETIVTSASPSPGTGGAPLDTDVYFNGGAQADWAWEFHPPEGSQSVLHDPALRTPHFRADVRGAYSLVEKRSGYNLFVWSGRYDLVPKDCGRADCHPREEQGWQRTAHAHVARHQPACVPCHSVGFDPGAANGGFDEACPNGQCPADRSVLGVVHCLACHGPGFRSAANYAEGSCSQCHDLPPKYVIVAEWRQAKMARLTPGLEPSVQVSLGGCPDCHSSQGFVRWMKGKPALHGLGPVYAAPVACPTCHDPHSGERPHQLRVFDHVRTRSGLELAGIGAGALCATCHNAGAPRAEAIRERQAPHAPQTDVLYAAGHRPAEPDLCVTCHVQRQHGGGGHTFEVSSATLKEASALRSAVEQLLAAARERLSERARRFTACADRRHGAAIAARDGKMVVLDDSGHDLGDCDRDGRIAPPERTFLVQDDALAADAWDFLLIERDGSHGAHNPEFARATLARLAGLPRAPARGR